MAIVKNSSQRRLSATLDWALIALYLVLVLIGWLSIYASIYATEPSSIFSFDVRSGKQFVWIATSLVLALVVVFAINPRLWEVISLPAYIVLVFLLVAVIFAGSEIKGSHSWFNFGFISFQPAEISKITTSLLLAAVMSRPTFKMTVLKDFARAAFIIALPMLIIVAENETGSALVYLGFLLVLYREGMSGWVLGFIGLMVLLFILSLTVSTTVAIAVLVVLAVVYYLLDIRGTRRGSIDRRRSRLLALAAIVVGTLFSLSTSLVFNKVLQDHQRSRIEVLLGLKEDISGVGYNVHQSMIAIGSGGFAGKGWLHGTQTTYGFVPEQSTDFIFCTIGEEFGFLGCLVVIALYLLLIGRILHDAEESREAFTRIYGYCVAGCIAMHLFVNIGMTIGLMPVIGIPLPLISYGGSSLWSFTLMIFIFIALVRQERKYF